MIKQHAITQIMHANMLMAHVNPYFVDHLTQNPLVVRLVDVIGPLKIVFAENFVFKI